MLVAKTTNFGLRLVILTIYSILLFKFKYCQKDFLAGLILVPPPIWVILCSIRTVASTIVYKFVLKREVTTLQFIGAGLMVASIIIAKLGEILKVEHISPFGISLKNKMQPDFHNEFIHQMTYRRSW